MLATTILRLPLARRAVAFAGEVDLIFREVEARTPRRHLTKIADVDRSDVRRDKIVGTAGDLGEDLPQGLDNPTTDRTPQSSMPETASWVARDGTLGDKETPLRPVGERRFKKPMS